MARYNDAALCANGLFRNIVQICAQQFDALNVVPLIELLIDGVGCVSRASHREKQNVLPGGLFESQSDRNAESS